MAESSPQPDSQPKFSSVTVVQRLTQSGLFYIFMIKYIHDTAGMTQFTEKILCTSVKINVVAAS